MRTTVRILTVTLALAATACEEGPGAARFRNAIPSEETLTIQAPQGADALALTLGERSEFYTFTRVTTVTVNSSIGAVFDLLENVIALPPTSVADDKATWGPGGDALDPNVYRLVVTERAEDRYDYVLEFRPKGTLDTASSYRALVSGSADKSSGKHDGSGTMVVHVDAWAVADGRTCGTGRLEVAYDTTSEPQKLEVAFVSFSTCENPGEVIDGARYSYERAADGSGMFLFSTHGDIQGGSVQPAVDEALELRSRWNATGAGRGDARVSGGDLPTSITSVTASECWNTSFALVYSTIDPAVIDPTRIAGDPSQCAFAELSLPGLR